MVVTERQAPPEEIEIDLVDLALELKKNIKLILGCALLCLALAAAYSFLTMKPSYTASGQLRLPSNTEAWQVNTCAELLRADQEEDFTLAAVQQVPDSFVLRLVFRGEEEEKVAQDLRSYLPTAVEKVNKLLVQKQEADFQRGLVNTIRRDVAALAAQPGVTAEEVGRRLAYIKTKVEELEADKVYLQAELLTAEPEVKEVVPDRQGNLILGLVCGLFFSVVYVCVRYFVRRTGGQAQQG